MDNKAIIALIIIIVCCAIGGLVYAGSMGTQSDDNDTLNNTTNTTNTTNETNITNETNETVVQDTSSNAQSQESQNNQYSSDSSASKSSSQKTYQDPHSDWVCEGDTWYSKQDSDGEGYVLYDKSTGRAIGSGDMPDRNGYHSQNYIDKESSSVKYRSNGEYYEG